MVPTDLQTQYDEAATWWQRTIYRLGYRHAYEELMPRALQNISASHVADIGTGTGDLAASYCIRLGAPQRLTLVDGSERMLDAARTNLRHIAQRIDTTHALLGDPIDICFDLVLCAHLIEHLPDSNQGMRDLGDLISPGGHLLLIVSRPHWCNWIIWLKWRHRWFSRTQIATMARSADLILIEQFDLHSGPPSRTSFGYLLRKPD